MNLIGGVFSAGDKNIITHPLHKNIPDLQEINSQKRTEQSTADRHGRQAHHTTQRPAQPEGSPHGFRVTGLALVIRCSRLNPDMAASDWLLLSADWRREREDTPD